jgi:hypothetical protein
MISTVMLLGIASTFYRVQMKLNMTMTVTGSDPGETIQTWVRNTTMTTLKLEDDKRTMTFSSI